VEPQITKRTNNDVLLREIHGICFGGRPTKSTQVKSDLLAFSGVVYEDDKKDREKLEDRIYKRHKGDIQEILAFFGQNPKGEKEDLVKRLADFLESPKASKDTYEVASSSSKKRSSSKSPSRKSPKKARKKKDPNAPKKALSGYMFFVKDARHDLAKKHPSEGVTDIAKRLGQAWGKLGKDEKRKYQDKADKDKSRYEREMKTYNKRGK